MSEMPTIARSVSSAELNAFPHNSELIKGATLITIVSHSNQLEFSTKPLLNCQYSTALCYTE